jgi:hypothetical protein
LLFPSFLLSCSILFLVRYAINELQLKAIQWKYYKQNESEQHHLQETENRSKRKLLEDNKPQSKSNSKQKKNELINLIDEDDIDDEVTEREVHNDDIELIDTDDEESDDVRNKKRKRAQPKNGKKLPKNHNKPSTKQIKNQKSSLQSEEDDGKDDDVSVTGSTKVDNQLSVKQHPNDPFLLSLSSSAVNNNKKANNENTVFRDSQYSRLHCIAKFLHAKLDASGYCDCEYDESILKSSLSSDYLLSTLEANSIANIENVMNAAAIPSQSILSNPDQQSISVIEAIYSSYQMFSDSDIWLSR